MRKTRFFFPKVPDFNERHHIAANLKAGDKPFRAIGMLHVHPEQYVERRAWACAHPYETPYSRLVARSAVDPYTRAMGRFMMFYGRFQSRASF